MAALESGLDKLGAFARRRKRWLVGIASAVVVYALLGFLAAPWLVNKLAVDGVRDNLNAELRLERVAINPFLLTLKVDGVELDDLDGEPVARLDTLFVDVQTSSLFRWALTFREIRLDAPTLFFDRKPDGALNVENLVRPADEPAPPPADKESGGPPRLLVREFAINDSAVHWLDEVPPEPVDTVFGPISVNVVELSTLPDRDGQQEVVIATETQGTLRWSGSLELNPFRTTGTAAVEGSHFPLVSSYIKHETGIDVLDGVADIRFRYAVDMAEEGLRASVDGLTVELRDVLVSTFVSNDDSAGREFVTFPSIALSDGGFKWPEREVRIGEVEIRDAVFDLLRLDDGRLDVVPASGEPSPESSEPETAASDGEPWLVSLDRFAVLNLTLGVLDQTIEPPASSGIRELNLEVLGIDNQPGSEWATTLSLSPQNGGTIRAAGPIVALPSPVVDIELVFDAVALEGIHPYLQAAADISLDSGALNLAGRLQHSPDIPLLFEADINIVEFLLTETDEGSRLGSWAALFVDGVSLDVGANELDISEVRMEEPYADILIAADGSVNLGRVRRGDGGGETPPKETVADNDAGNPMAITVGRIVINDAAADFADESLPLPFAARIDELSGAISTIATTSEEASNIELEGKVDEFGLVRVTGFATPLEIARRTDIKVEFENVEIPKFSAYTIPFAGREIASGRLDLDLGYAVTNSELVGENRVVLRDFELGDEVPHPDAMSLPLGLAVALLKDSSGKIDIELPVRGNVDDPEFGYGKVIRGAIANLIVKIVASPFALLGNLVGVEADELEYINFPPGRADLTPPELERANKLAEALALRPELILEVHGVIDREADSLALRTMRVDDVIEGRIEAAEDDDASYTEQRFVAIEALFAEAVATEEPGLDEIRTRFTSVVTNPESGREETVFDALAYAEFLRDRLIDAEPLGEEALVELGAARREGAAAAVVAAGEALDARVVKGELREETRDREEDVVRMKVVLSAGGE